MNKRDRGILYGMALGDGCISKQATNKNHGLIIGHGPKQKEYLEHKASTLHKLFGGKPVKVYSYEGFNKASQKTYTNHQLRKVHPYFNQMHKNLYPNGVKQFSRKVLDFLTDEGLAYWFMDDGAGGVIKNNRGNPCGCNIRISTYCTKEEAEIISTWFKDKYELDCSFDVDKRNNKYSLRFNTFQSKSLAKILEPYILPQLRYKIEDVLSYSPRVLGPVATTGEDIV